MGISDGLIIVGGFAIGIFVSYFVLLDMFNISLNSDDNFINTLLPYTLLLGLATLGSGIGIKIYKWKNS
jgi:hypothetical protein